MSDDENQNEQARPKTLETKDSHTNPPSGDPPAPSNGQQKNTISPEKLAANRKNGSRSNGPTTPEGKARSSQNSYKHGFFARQPLPPGEVGAQLWQEYEDLAAGIWDYYQPVGYMEGLLTEKIATESIRFSRLLAYESKFVGGLRDFDWNGVDRILRFQGTINRQLFQAIRELERLQDKRRSKVAPPEGPSHDPGGSTGSPRVDDRNQGLEEASTREEALGNAVMEVLPVSRWKPIPLGPSVAKSGQGQASQPSPGGANYGTNPTPASSKPPDNGPASKRSSAPKTSLTDRATKVFGLPPMEDSAKVASTGPDLNLHAEHRDREEEISYSTELIAPGDEALFEEIQETTRKAENERPDDPHDPEDSS